MKNKTIITFRKMLKKKRGKKYEECKCFGYDKMEIIALEIDQDGFVSGVLIDVRSASVPFMVRDENEFTVLDYCYQ